MKRTPALGRQLAVAMCTLAVAAAAIAAPPRSTVPAPRLRFVGTELYSANAKDWVRYKYDVTNKSRYSDALFAASPDLPPCGLNSSAARTWVDFYDSDGKRLYGFCALKQSADLGKLWFSVEKGLAAPSKVYIELTDRRTSKKYRSNLASTALPVRRHK